MTNGGAGIAVVVGAEVVEVDVVDVDVDVAPVVVVVGLVVVVVAGIVVVVVVVVEVVGTVVVVGGVSFSVADVMVTSTVISRIDGCCAAASPRGAVPSVLKFEGWACTREVNDTMWSLMVRLAAAAVSRAAPGRRLTVR